MDRYKGHAIRKNVAVAHRSAAMAAGVEDPWNAVFEAAAAEDDHGLGALLHSGFIRVMPSYSGASWRFP